MPAAPEWTPMRDIAPFLDDILANPHDDAPRLVLADWIEENGDGSLRPLGEFIRVQYALEGMHPGNPRRPGLEKLQAALLPAQWERWREALALTRIHTPNPVFRRGFIEHISVGLGELDGLGKRRGGGVPLRSLAVHYHGSRGSGRVWASEAAEQVARGAGAAILGQIEELDLVDVTFPSDEARRAWMGSPRLKRLRSLAIKSDEALIRALLEGTLGRQIRSLEIRHAGGRPLPRRSRGGALPDLESLTFRSEQAWDGPFLESVAALSMPALTRVRFTGSGLPQPRHVPPSFLARISELALPPEWLVSAPHHLPRLETLRLPPGTLSAETIPHLARLLPLPLLWTLDVSNNRLGDGGAALARSPMMREVRAFRASYCGIDRAGAAALCRALPADLSTLDLSWNPIGGAAFAELPAGVGALDAGYCEVDDEAIPSLAAWPAGKLHSLNLGTNRLTDHGAGILLSSPAAEGLEALDLSHNRLTDAVVDRLLDSPVVGRLRLLLLFGNGISHGAMRRLRERCRGIVA